MLTALSAVLSAPMTRGRSLSYDPIAGYLPASKVTPHNAIDLDQNAIQTYLGELPIDFDTAFAVYSNGGNSKTYATITFTTPLSTAISAGTAWTSNKGGPSDDQLVSGTVKSTAAAGATTIDLYYATKDTHSSASPHVACSVGSLKAAQQVNTGCLSLNSDDIQVGTGSGAVVLDSTAVENLAGRTIKGFSTGAESKMYNGCFGCPYLDYSQFYDYYGDFDYANKFVTAAFNGAGTGFTNADKNMDFTGVQDVVREECSQKGTVLMSIHMYVIREYEDAIDDCLQQCAGSSSCNEHSADAVHAWDEGVAFYTGSIEGSTGTPGTNDGVLGYYMADKRGPKFGTCLSDDGLSGGSMVNKKIGTQLALGQHKLLTGECEAARPIVREIVAQMNVPLVQGTLRYAYKVDKLLGGDKEKAEGAVFMAAVVPRVHSCSTGDAAIIFNNMKLDATSTDFAAVKGAFERNYACMNITCADVGGLWFGAQNTYYDGASPCSDPSTTDAAALAGGAIAGIVIAAGIALLALIFILYMVCKEKSGAPLFSSMENHSKTATATKA